MYRYLNGGSSCDSRGEIRFVNEFDMSLVRRFYLIKNLNIDVVRGWRGHKNENRWFYPISGSFILQLVQIDNWQNPSKTLPVSQEILTASGDRLLHIPNGYATTIQSIEEDSQLLVFADSVVVDAHKDDYTWDLDYFLNKK
ncbi:WxcM-like domain-containing protein [Sphingobacterium hotanense]|uniref:WxcM-like domain-containing protein n=1 Tax=Sphingobacterium hotanense TaxID=649196 RepID=A0ABT7NLC2_9SPHI|nr:WxcM-like domain-containing protein [Sphingobacterium hotanense]MDM1047945.1 WxcM-like domain-containing protein [Sphingobacterium hotanense]